MNLRKTILIFTLVLFGVLMYTNFMSFTVLSQVATNMEVSLNTLTGSGNALIIWLQFPLILFISVILVYLIFADDSLTKQSTK